MPNLHVFAMALAIALLPDVVHATALVSPRVWATNVPLQSTAVSSSGREALVFRGAGMITSRVTTDPLTGAKKLLATFKTNGVTATGAVSATRYPLVAQEALVLVHAPIQNVSIQLPLEPFPGSPAALLRTALVTYSLVVDMSTGAVVSATLTHIKAD